MLLTGQIMIRPSSIAAATLCALILQCAAFADATSAPATQPTATLTITVKVTDCPGPEGLTEEVTAAVVLAWLTVCVSAAEVLVAKLLSPP